MSSLIYLITGIVLFIGYKVYRSVRVPKGLENLPTISFFALLKCHFQGKSYADQIETIFQPALERGNGIAKVWKFGRYEIVIANYSSIKQVLNDSETFLNNDPNYRDTNTLLSKYFGDGSLFSVDGGEWRRHRKVMNPPLKKKWDTQVFANLATKMSERIVDQPSGSAVKVAPMFQQLTLDALGLALLGYNFRAMDDEQNEDAYLKLYHDLMKAMFDPIYLVFPFLENLIPARRLAHDKLKRFKKFLQGIILQRKRQIEEDSAGDDLLTQMIKSSQSTKDGTLEDHELLDNLTALFMAGHDTTANTLTSTLYFLAKHQDVQVKARSEVLTALDNEKGTIPVTPTFEHQREFKYLDQVIKESMRTISTVPQVLRYCTKTTRLDDGLEIPANTFVSLYQWFPMHDTTVYPDPNQFDPSRFEQPKSTQESNWIPFGYGPRMCAGVNFSLTEQRVVMAILLQKFELELTSKLKALPRPHLKEAGFVSLTDLEIIFKPRF